MEFFLGKQDTFGNLTEINNRRISINSLSDFVQQMLDTKDDHGQPNECLLDCIVGIDEMANLMKK